MTLPVTSKAPNSTLSSLVLLFDLIEANDWKKLNNIFLTESGAKTFRRLAGLVAKSESFSGMTILHGCVRFNPPPNVVSRMIELCPHAPTSLDCLDRTPLHIAAGTNASSAVVNLLVEAFPDACSLKDKDGRTPLHMACDAECELFEDKRSKRLREAPSYRTINILLSASLDSAVLEDEDGMSAIEYALFSNAELKTVRLLQSAAQRVMLHKHKEEQANKAKGKLCNNRIKRETRNFSPKALLSAPMA
jgi:hypothetical protein